MYNTYIKYPRTFHLPYSPNATDDDKKLKSDEHFNKLQLLLKWMVKIALYIMTDIFMQDLQMEVHIHGNQKLNI